MLHASWRFCFLVLNYFALIQLDFTFSHINNQRFVVQAAWQDNARFFRVWQRGPL